MAGERYKSGNVHFIKTWPEAFDSVVDGLKHHEVRKNDRNYLVGDILVLRCFLPETQSYTGAVCVVLVTYVTFGGACPLCTCKGCTCGATPSKLVGLAPYHAGACMLGAADQIAHSKELARRAGSILGAEGGGS